MRQRDDGRRDDGTGSSQGDSGRHDREDDGLDVDICDACGQRLGADACLDAVPDSSAIHGHDPEKDGLRLIVACSPEHLAALQEKYRRRPFVDEELWAGKISHALRAHPEGLTRIRLSAVTGLRRDEIERAVAWQDEQIRRRRRPHDDDPAHDNDCAHDDDPGDNAGEATAPQ